MQTDTDSTTPPDPDPAPAPGCSVCDGWVRRRAYLRSVLDYSGVTDCNVMIRRHRARNDHNVQQ